MTRFTDAYECDLSFSCDVATSALVVSYTEYTISFDLVLSNYNESNYVKSDVKTYISGVINVNTGSIKLSNVVTATDSVSLTVTVTFETESEAQSFSTDVDNNVFDFGGSSSVGNVGNVYWDVIEEEQ